MSKSILLIDADQPFTGPLSASLTDSGFGVQVLPDGKDALDVARGSIPSLIVLCVELPNGSGYSVCNKLKKDEDLKGIPLIITSSEATPETFAQHKKLKTRAEDYLIKPFDPPAILEKIAALIGLPEPGGAPEEVVATGSDELDFDSLTAQPDENDAALASLDGLDGLGDDPLAALSDPGEVEPLSLDDDPLAALGSDSLELVEAEPAPSSDDLGGDNLDDLLGPAPTKAAPPSRPPPARPPPVPAASRPPLRTGGPDLETERALKEARKENTDLKARVVQLEGKLKLAEEQLQRATANMEGGKSSSLSAAKEVLGLKEQLNAKDKELLALREEVFAKEKEAMERGEAASELEQRASMAETARSEAETQVATLETRLQAAEQHLADAESISESRVADMVAQLQDLQGRVAAGEAAENELSGMRIRLEELEGSLAVAQEDGQKNEERLIKAHRKLKHDEQVREKLRRALDIAQQLVSDAVVESGEESGADA